MIIALPQQLISNLSSLITGTFANRAMSDLSSVTFSPDSFDSLCKEIDKHIEMYPGNLDLLHMKSSVLRTACQWKSGEEVIDEILRIDPQQFDARLIKDSWDTWPHVAELPHIDVSMTSLPAILKTKIQKRSVFQVRDGIRVGIALISDVSSLQFQRPLSQDMRCDWKFVLSDTPHGRIVAHYPMVEDGPGASFIQEMILMTGPSSPPNDCAGYWLLQRLARIPSAMIILTSGEQICYTGRCSFAESTRVNLRRIASTIKEKPQQTTNPEAAIRYHIEHYDVSGIHF